MREGPTAQRCIYSNSNSIKFRHRGKEMTDLCSGCYKKHHEIQKIQIKCNKNQHRKYVVKTFIFQPNGLRLYIRTVCYMSPLPRTTRDIWSANNSCVTEWLRLACMFPPKQGGCRRPTLLTCGSLLPINNNVVDFCISRFREKKKKMREKEGK